MSTRATYTIHNEELRPQTYYIHHDGYEAGAKSYFQEMVDYEGPGSNQDRFIKANIGATFTYGREAHGDTEYHYDLSVTGLVTMQESEGFTEDGPRDWVTIKTIDLDKWLEEVNNG
jgi:hypothetical protein